MVRFEAAWSVFVPTLQEAQFLKCRIYAGTLGFGPCVLLKWQNSNASVISFS